MSPLEAGSYRVHIQNKVRVISRRKQSGIKFSHALIDELVLTTQYLALLLMSKATEQWYEIQDLHVQETMPQLVGLSESYMLIYERQELSTAAAAAESLQSELY